MFDFWRVVLLLTSGGVIGGLLYWASVYLSNADKAGNASSNEWKASVPFCLANAFMGIGGAWAALLAMLWAKRAPLGSATEDLLELLATSIVAGYAGNRILPVVADRLTKELLESTARKVTTAAKSANRSRVISEVLAYLDLRGSQTEHQTKNFIALLQAELKQNPEFREAAILQARVFAELKKDNRRAISILQDFIASKRRAGKEDDENVGDAFWNLANYFEEEFRLTGEPKDRQEAISALRESLRILPNYRSNYLEDEDFKELRDDPEAKSCLG
jgi:tetratricopeptide (TPR) repeat protein